MYLCLFLSVNVKPRYISWLPDCQTESVGGDIHRGAFSGTFMRDFFPWLKRRLTTHSKVASALHTHARLGPRVCVCACVRVWACTLRRPSFERSYVGCQGCVLLRVLFRRALPRAAEVLPEAVGAHPQFCVSATKERIGAFREERRERKGGEGMTGAVSLGMSRPCGWLSTRSYTHKHTHTATVTTGLRRSIPVHTLLLACSK